MTPAARAAAAIEVLDRWRAGDARAEKVLREWGRANRYAGSKDRRAISDLVYHCIRRMRSLSWLGGGTDGRAMILGLIRDEGADPDDVFTGDRYAPAPLTAEERAAPEAPPQAVTLDHPDWMSPHLIRSLGDGYEAAMSTLQTRAPVGLRVNLLKSSVERAAASLAEDGVETMPSPLSPTALIAPPGAPVARAEAFLAGEVELQDAASQAAADLAAPRAGETVLDYCAGGGGKALALAGAMEGRGRVIIHDAAPQRLTQAMERADRAGAQFERRGPRELDDLKGACDLVYVDAPCSGSGSWRRDPEGKWRLTEKDVLRYQSLQREIFAEALNYVRPGGRIAYATCSLFDLENTQQSSYFGDSYSGLRSGEQISLMPDAYNDGFFCQIFHLS